MTTTDVARPNRRRPGKPNPAQRRKKTESPALQKAAEGHRIVMPLIVRGATWKREVTITPAEYGRLDVDPEYQRGKTDEIQDLITVLQHGGVLLGEIILAERAWGPDVNRRLLWVVDGFQRVSAYQALDKSFVASVFVTESLADEAALFEAANTRRILSANVQVKAWPGPSATLLRRLDTKPDSPVFDRISWKNSSPHKLSASVLIYGTKDLLTGRAKGGSIQWALARTDAELATPRALDAARIFIEFVGLVSPKSYIRMNVVRGLAVVARERWERAGGSWVCSMPSAYQMERLRQVNWSSVVPSFAARFQPIILDHVRKIWK